MRLRLLLSLLALSAGTASAGVSARRVVSVRSSATGFSVGGWASGQKTASFRTSFDLGLIPPLAFQAPSVKSFGSAFAANEPVANVSVFQPWSAVSKTAGPLSHKTPLADALSRTHDTLKSIDPSSPLKTKLALDALIEDGPKRGDDDWTSGNENSEHYAGGLNKTPSKRRDDGSGPPSDIDADPARQEPPPPPRRHRLLLAGYAAALLTTPVALGIQLLQHSWRMPIASDWLPNLHNPLVWPAVAGLAALDAFVLDRWITKTAPTKLSGDTPKSVKKTLEQPLLVSLAIQAGMAVGEELAFRWFLFGALWAFLAGLGWAPLLAFAAASAASSLAFGLAHGYGRLWPRVFGGLLYCAVFAVTGNPLFPILLHFLGNASITVSDRRRP